MRDKPSPELMRALETLGKRPVQPPATPQEPESPYKPCPFCGGQAEKIAVDEASNMGGYVVTCCSCDASSAVVFPVKDSPDGLLNVLWNRRASTPSPEGQTAEIARAAELLRIAARLLRAACADVLVFYDETECDATCLANDCEAAADALPSPPIPEGTQP